MNEKQFESEFASMLYKFDDLFDTPENYDAIALSVNEDIPDASEIEKQMLLYSRLQETRTNNLIRVALKTFLVKD